MPDNFDGTGPDPARQKDLSNPTPKRKDNRGGARKGSGKKPLTSKNMIPIVVRLSLLERDWEKINKYTDLRDDTKHRVDILRDILSFVIDKLESSGLSEKEQAEATRDLNKFFKTKIRKEDKK